MKVLKILILLGLMAFFTPAVHAEGEVVVYTALDKEFSEPIFKAFEAETGITVKAQYDTEAVKTVGLVNRLLAERHRPRADVFWNNEILRSIQLKKEGLTEAYTPKTAEGIPPHLVDKDHHWTGFAARARVILVNKTLLPDPAEWPKSVQALADPKWKGKAAYAKPLFGTTNTHAAIIWAQAGEEQAKAFWNAAMENSVMLAGNAMARDAVAAGEAAWCLTDTDDAHGVIEDGANVAIVYPEDDPAGEGTILIPNTVALMKNSPNPENGKVLIDYLVSKEVEAGLAASRSAQIPVRSDVKGPEKIPALKAEQVLAIDWEKAYEAIAPSTGWLEKKISGQ